MHILDSFIHLTFCSFLRRTTLFDDMHTSISKAVMSHSHHPAQRYVGLQLGLRANFMPRKLFPFFWHDNDNAVFFLLFSNFSLSLASQSYADVPTYVPWIQGERLH